MIVFRYVRLMAYFMRFSLSRSMEFRMDFFFRIVMDILFYVVNIAFYKVIFLHTTSLGGWNSDQILIFVGGYLVADAVHMTFFTNNFYFLPVYVNHGDLDYYLLRPVSSLFFLSLRDFAVNSFVNLLIASSILIWAIDRYPGHLGGAKILLFLGALGVGMLIQYTLAILFILPVFWTHSVNGFRQVYWSFSRFIERPDGIFTGWARKALTFILPFALIASFPTRVLLEDFSLRTLSHLLGVAIALFSLLLWLWSRALRSYSSASS